VLTVADAPQILAQSILQRLDAYPCHRDILISSYNNSTIVAISPDEVIPRLPLQHPGDLSVLVDQGVFFLRGTRDKPGWLNPRVGVGREGAARIPDNTWMHD
jgi:hypothetical protein